MTPSGDLPLPAWKAAPDGGKGPFLYDWAAVRLPAVAEFDYQGEVPHRMRWALARRSIRKPDEIAYCLAYAPLETTVQELVRIAGTRWAIEACFQAAKNECGVSAMRFSAVPIPRMSPDEDLGAVADDDPCDI